MGRAKSAITVKRATVGERGMASEMIAVRAKVQGANVVPVDLAAVTDAFAGLTTPRVRLSPLVREAYDARQRIPIYSPHAHVVRDYQQVANHLTARGVL